jgi:hypothetical protein
MKKWLIATLILLFLLVASIYLFIPNIISVSQSISIKANKDGLYRNLFEEKNWGKWWPADTVWEKDGLHHFSSYNDYVYRIDNKGISSFGISITGKNFKAVTSLILFSTRLDSVKLVWEARIPASYNPLKRLQVYLKSRKLSNDIKTILEKMQSFFSKTGNVYGFDIRNTSVVDTALISTFASSNDYPSTEFVYGLIDQLKKYITAQSAKETGFPMLNVSTADSINFLIKVAIPTDKELPSSGNISYKWMRGGGNILVTEVKGGPSTIAKAFQQIENYVTDHEHKSPAIPFQSLITDRRLEPDTTKWITRIYYPVL